MAKDEKGGAYITEAQSRARNEWEEKKRRKEEARIERQKVRDEMTDEEQLARLDRMFGEGLGAKKERAKLAARIEARKQKKQKKSSEKSEA